MTSLKAIFSQLREACDVHVLDGFFSSRSHRRTLISMSSLAITSPQTDKQCWNGGMFHTSQAVTSAGASTEALCILPLTARLIKGLSAWDCFCWERFEICLNIPSRCSYLGLRPPAPISPNPQPCMGDWGCVSRFRNDSRGVAYGCTVKNTSVVLLVQWNDVGSNKICKT